MNRAERRAAKKWNLREFREQAIEAQGQVAGVTLTNDDGEEFDIPHPSLLDDEAQERVEAFQRGDGLDRETLINTETGEPLLTVTGEPLTRIKEPHQINGVVLESATIRSAKAILGEKEHARFIAGGITSNDIGVAWRWMVEQAKEAEANDPK